MATSYFFLMVLPWVTALLAPDSTGVAGFTLRRLTTASVERETWVMGTRLRVEVQGSTRVAAALAAESGIREVERMDELLSSWDADSEISALRSGPPEVPAGLSAEVIHLLLEAERWAHRTGRAFDPRVGALMDAWDLRGPGAVPTPASLQAALRASGPGTFSIDSLSATVTRHAPAAWIDSGAFGKGAALRNAAEVLRGEGITRALLDLGGQLWGSGPDDHPWTVAVAHPSRRWEPTLLLRIQNVSVATSGGAERWVEVGGKRFGHVLDPRSGQPVPAWGSVTVVSPDPLEADVLSTALFVMGPEEGLRWISNNPRVGALFLQEKEGQLIPSWNPTMERWLLTLTQPGAGEAPRRFSYTREQQIS